MKTSRIVSIAVAALTLTAAALVRDGRQHAKARDELLEQQIKGQKEVIRQLDHIAQELPQLKQTALPAAPTTVVVAQPREPDVAWVRQESFWQGVVIQALGTLLAALVIVLIAAGTRMGGYPVPVLFWAAYITSVVFISIVWFARMIPLIRAVAEWNILAAVCLAIVIYGLLAGLLIEYLFPFLRTVIGKWVGYL
jgi:hypothetical protein